MPFLSPFFGWEGSPKIDYRRKKGKTKRVPLFYPPKLEDLAPAWQGDPLSQLAGAGISRLARMGVFLRAPFLRRVGFKGTSQGQARFVLGTPILMRTHRVMLTPDQEIPRVSIGGVQLGLVVGFRRVH